MTALADTARAGFVPLAPPSGRGSLFVRHAAVSPDPLARDLFVWVPDHPAPPEGFPVLYMQDGQNLFDARLVPFGTAWEIDRSLSRLADAGAIVPAIVVGAASTAARFNEYAPSLLLDRLTGAAREVVEAAWGGPARSAGYARLIIETVKPLIDAHFPTCATAGATYVGGSSLGAVAALEILARYPRRVAGAACLSAHFSLLPVTEAETLPNGFADDVTAAVADFADACLPRAGRHAIWIDRSALGIDRFYGPTHMAIIDALSRRGFVMGVDLAARYYPDVGHDEAAWRARIDDVLIFLLGHEAHARRGY
ncbi:MAG: alpha/beta hydrolase-fold protein [Sphingomonas sp.]|jgi:enterochelin esterase-like enzyme|uniref:alpha/beta hydrolase n=1 Tax=Sphingomonas sp. TaxID=28214 RepID=UPI003565F1E3